MCELFAMSADRPASPALSMRRLAASSPTGGGALRRVRRASAARARAGGRMRVFAHDDLSPGVEQALSRECRWFRPNRCDRFRARILSAARADRTVVG